MNLKVIYKKIIFSVLLLLVFNTIVSISAGYTENDIDPNTVFLDAVISGDTSLAKELLMQGADINAKDEFGQTCLHVVKNTDLAEYLISYGADVSAKEKDFGMTPIFFQDAGIAKLLLDNGADVNARSNKGYTPLIWYAYSGYTKGAKLLISAGADINAVNGAGQNALQIAETFHHPDLIRYLISLKAE